MRARYGAVAIGLHWLTAAAILFQLGLAWRMDEGKTPEGFALIQLHKSVGITILALSLARLAWRFANPPPPLPAGLAPWERLVSRIVHASFYVILIGMPLTGWIMVSTSRIEIPTLLYGVVPWPHVPGLADLPAAAKHAWNAAAEQGHHLLGWGLYLLLALHVGGALKHQLLDRDQPVLARMAPGAVSRRRLEPRLLLVLVGAVGAMAAAYMIQPKVRLAPPPPPAPAPVEAAAPVEAPAPVVTAPPIAAKPEPAPWTVSPGSTLNFTTKWDGQEIGGRFDRWRADILFDPDALDRSRVRVEVDVASANVGEPQIAEALPGADWLDAGEHPKAVFTATRFEKTGEGRFVAHGKLSLRGVSQPLSLPFRLRIEGDRARVSGVTSLDRTAFGVGQGEWKSTDQIPAQVAVKIDLTARRR